MITQRMYRVSSYLEWVLSIDIELAIDDTLDTVTSAYTKGNCINISKQWLEQLEDKDEIVPVLAHEAFHIWQRKAIAEGLVPEERSKQWQNEFDNYHDISEGIEKHWNQNIEQTATIFSDNMAKEIIGLNLSNEVRCLFKKEDVEFVNSLDLCYLPFRQ